jgi:hypothetical protein
MTPPQLPPRPISPRWVANPNGLTTLTGPNLIFIEAGANKRCYLWVEDCQFHPNMSSKKASDLLASYKEDTTATLAVGGRYQYKVYYIGSNKWEAQWCGSTCAVMSDVDLQTSTAFPSAASGGEANCGACPIGSITTSNNQYMLGGTTTWTPYCHNATVNDVAPLGGTISTCGAIQD